MIAMRTLTTLDTLMNLSNLTPRFQTESEGLIEDSPVCKSSILRDLLSNAKTIHTHTHTHTHIYTHIQMHTHTHTYTHTHIYYSKLLLRSYGSSLLEYQ